MLPGPYNFTIYQGDGYTFVMNLKAGANPFDVTGFTFVGGIAKQRGGPKVASFVVDIVGDPEDGVVNVKLTGAEATAVTAGIWYYDVQMTSPADVPTTLLTGVITSVGQVN